MDQQDLKGPEAPTETFAAPDRLRAEALSRQLQNLLLLQPLFHLEANKGRLGGEQHALFEGIDTLFLSLSLFDFISERMVMDLGARRQEIVTHLSDEIASMEAALAHDERGRSNSSLEQCQAMAGAVLDTLANARNRHRLFELSYFDPQRVTDSTLHGGGMRRRAFRLLRLTDQPDGILRYLLTPEGITAYLSMLDVDPALAQQAEEILVQRLMERGRFRDARRLARRSRTRTMELREILRKHLLRAQRAGGSVAWSSETKPRIDDALSHIQERQNDENAILRGIEQHDLNGLDPEARTDLVGLRETISECYRQHGRLHEQVMDINARFLDLQARGFHATESRAVADPEAQILVQLLELSSARLSPIADAITSLMNRPKITPLFDPLNLFEVLEQGQTDESGTESEDDEDLEALEKPLERFSPQMQAQMLAYARSCFKIRPGWRLSEFLIHAEEDGCSDLEIACLAYLLIGAHHPKDDRIGLSVSRSTPFHHRLIDGHDLIMERRNAEADHD